MSVLYNLHCPIFCSAFPSIAPSVPTSSEVTGTTNSTDSVSVTVSLRGCSLHTDPSDHQICVSVYCTCTCMVLILHNVHLLEQYVLCTCIN